MWLSVLKNELFFAMHNALVVVHFQTEGLPHIHLLVLDEKVRHSRFTFQLKKQRRKK